MRLVQIVKVIVGYLLYALLVTRHFLENFNDKRTENVLPR